MKKRLFCIFIIVPFLFSCGVEIPESISIKTKAKYSFSFGKKDFDLKEYISAEKLTSSMEGNGKNPKVYVYNPQGNTKMQYLVSYPIDAVKVNLADKNFSDIELPTFEAKKIEQTIEVPKFSADASSVNTIKEIDINDMLFGTGGEAELKIAPVSIDESVLSGKSLSKADAETSNLNRDVKIQITDGGFSTMLLEQGYILIKRTDTASVKTNLTIELCDQNENIITSKTGVDFFKNEQVQLDLAEKTVTSQMKLYVYGEFSSASGSGGTSTYTLTPTVESMKIKEVKGLTLPEKTLNVENELTITTDSSFVSCQIEKGSVKLTSKIHSEVSGLNVISRNISLSQAITVNEDGWQKNESSTTILNRSYALDGKACSTNPIKIKFEGSVNYKLENASVTLENGASIKIEIIPECKVEKLKSVQLDLVNHKDGFTIEKVANNFGANIAGDVSKIVLNPSGLKITYKNELPVGNDFKVDYECELLGLKKNLVLKATGPSAEQTEEKDFCAQDKEITVTNSTSFVLEPKLHFPGAQETLEAGKEYYTTLTGIAPGATYSIFINVEPIFDWKSITIKMSESGLSGLSGEKDSNISLSSMFDSIKESCSNFGNISFNQIEVFLYFINPGVSGLDSESFKGKVFAKSNEGTVYILGSETEVEPLKFVNEQELKFNDSNEVVSRQIPSMASAHSKEIAKLFNSKEDGTGNKNTIKFGYDMNVGNSNSGNAKELDISKDFYEKLKKEDANEICIPIEARILVPLIFNISDTTKLDLKKLKNSNSEGEEATDFFNRSEATDMSSYEKFLEVIDSVNLKYEFSKEFLEYSDGSSSAKIYFGTSEHNFNLPLNSSSTRIKGEDVIDMLKTYPYKPELYVELPKGTVSVPYFTEAGISFSMEIFTDGKVSIWEK